MLFYVFYIYMSFVFHIISLFKKRYNKNTVYYRKFLTNIQNQKHVNQNEVYIEIKSRKIILLEKQHLANT